MKQGDLTYEEILKGADQGWLAIISMGCAKQQGWRLHGDIDIW